MLEFGTELVCTADGTLAALLGASPGASTAVTAMLQVMEKCFTENYNSINWQQQFKNIIPTFGKKWTEYDLLCTEIREWTHDILQLERANL